MIEFNEVQGYGKIFMRKYGFTSILRRSGVEIFLYISPFVYLHDTFSVCGVIWAAFAVSFMGYIILGICFTSDGRVKVIPPFRCLLDTSLGC
jgi:hypothetical protein